MPDDEKPYLIAAPVAFRALNAGPCRVPQPLRDYRDQQRALLDEHQRSLAIAQREVDMRTAQLAALNFAIQKIEEQEGPTDVRARTTGKRRNLRQIVLDDIAANPPASSVDGLVERTGLRDRAVKSAIEYLLANDKIEPVDGLSGLYELRSATVTSISQRIEE